VGKWEVSRAQSAVLPDLRLAAARLIFHKLIFHPNKFLAKKSFALFTKMTFDNSACQVLKSVNVKVFAIEQLEGL
jgi:hypothetical protein